MHSHPFCSGIFYEINYIDKGYIYYFKEINAKTKNAGLGTMPLKPARWRTTAWRWSAIRIRWTSQSRANYSDSPPKTQAKFIKNPSVRNQTPQTDSTGRLRVRWANVTWPTRFKMKSKLKVSFEWFSAIFQCRGRSNNLLNQNEKIISHVHFWNNPARRAMADLK